MKKGYQKETCERYQDIFEKKEIKKIWQYDCKQYTNFPEHEKQGLIEHRKNYYKLWKNAS